MTWHLSHDRGALDICVRCGAQGFMPISEQECMGHTTDAEQLKERRRQQLASPKGKAATIEAAIQRAQIRRIDRAMNRAKGLRAARRLRTEKGRATT